LPSYVSHSPVSLHSSGDLATIGDLSAGCSSSSSDPSTGIDLSCATGGAGTPRAAAAAALAGGGGGGLTASASFSALSQLSMHAAAPAAQQLAPGPAGGVPMSAFGVDGSSGGGGGGDAGAVHQLMRVHSTPVLSLYAQQQHQHSNPSLQALLHQNSHHQLQAALFATGQHHELAPLNGLPALSPIPLAGAGGSHGSLTTSGPVVAAIAAPASAQLAPLLVRVGSEQHLITSQPLPLGAGGLQRIQSEGRLGGGGACTGLMVPLALGGPGEPDSVAARQHAALLQQQHLEQQQALIQRHQAQQHALLLHQKQQASAVANPSGPLHRSHSVAVMTNARDGAPTGADLLHTSPSFPSLGSSSRSSAGNLTLSSSFGSSEFGAAPVFGGGAFGGGHGSHLSLVSTTHSPLPPASAAAAAAAGGIFISAPAPSPPAPSPVLAALKPAAAAAAAAWGTPPSDDAHAGGMAAGEGAGLMDPAGHPFRPTSPLMGAGGGLQIGGEDLDVTMSFLSDGPGAGGDLGASLLLE
jgi:hypothetical protein